MTVSVETFVLTCRPEAVPSVVRQLETILVGQAGFLGCWTAELGTLNRIRVLFSKAPDDLIWPGCESGVVQIDRVAWSVHGGFLPKPGCYGAAWEWRVYDILPGGEDVVLGLMEVAVPARSQISPLYALMVSRSGPTRLCHVWPYKDLAERAELRREAVASGLWPPKGIQPFLGSMKSEILIPVGYSPSL